VASTGCLASRLKADFEADLGRWVGHPIAEFCSYKGNPEKVLPRPEGGEVYVFLLISQRARPYQAVLPVGARGSLDQPTTLTGSGSLCRLFLETDRTGIILTTRWQGSDCW
jgi:hypothetical protein